MVKNRAIYCSCGNRLSNQLLEPDNWLREQAELLPKPLTRASFQTSLEVGGARSVKPASSSSLETGFITKITQSHRKDVFLLFCQHIYWYTVFRLNFGITVCCKVDVDMIRGTKIGE